MIFNAKRKSYPVIPDFYDKNKAPFTGEDMNYSKNLKGFTQTEQFGSTGAKMVMGKFPKQPNQI